MELQDHRRLTRIFKRDSRAIRLQIAANLVSEALSISVRKVQWTSISVGFRRRWIIHVPLLIAQHKALGFEWARQHRLLMRMEMCCLI